MLAFSWIAVDGLEKNWRSSLTGRRIAEAYVHCWNVVGHLLGIPLTTCCRSAQAEAKSPRHGDRGAPSVRPRQQMGQNLTSALNWYARQRCSRADVFDPVGRG